MSILPFFLGLEGWEKRLIISDRAHIGKRGYTVFIYNCLFIRNMKAFNRFDL